MPINPPEKTKQLKKSNQKPGSRTKNKSNKRASVKKGAEKSKEKRSNAQPVQTEAVKAKAKKHKALSILFNKLKAKIGTIEPLAPTWAWTCNIEKNVENARYCLRHFGIC